MENKKELTVKEALSKASFYCSASEHCSAEVMEKLKQWGMSNVEKQEEVIQHLIRENYIDEQRYCRAFVHDKYRFNKWGKAKIAMTLKQKALPTTYINEAMTTIDEEEYISILKELLRTKDASIRNASPYERYGKLMRFAIGRGFETEAVSKAIQALQIGYEAED